MPKTKKLEESSDSDSGPEDRNPPPKKAKGDGDSAKSDLRTNDPTPTWKLDRGRLIKVNEFKGRKSVDIREYYTDKATGELRPGKKGISLSRSEFETLISLADEIKAEI